MIESNIFKICIKYSCFFESCSWWEAIFRFYYEGVIFLGGEQSGKLMSEIFCSSSFSNEWRESSDISLQVWFKLKVTEYLTLLKVYFPNVLIQNQRQMWNPRFLLICENILSYNCWDSSVGKVLPTQLRDLSLIPQAPWTKERLTPGSCPVTFMCMSWHMYHVHNGIIM